MRRILLLAVLGLVACSSPDRVSNYDGLALAAGSGQDAIVLNNPGAKVNFGSGNTLADESGKLAASNDVKLKAGLLRVPVSVAQADGGYPLGSASVYLCDATTAATTLFLPLADAGVGRVYTALKTDVTTHGCTFSAGGTDTLNKPASLAAATLLLPDAGSSATVVSDGVNKWWVISTQ